MPRGESYGCRLWQFWVIIVIEYQKPPGIPWVVKPILHCIDDFIKIVFLGSCTQPAPRGMISPDLFNSSRKGGFDQLFVDNVQPKYRRVIVSVTFGERDRKLSFANPI